MKNILYVSNHNPFGTSYGAEQRSKILLEAFIQNGYTVDVAYIGENAKRPEKNAAGVNVVYWNSGETWNISKMASRKRLYLCKMFSASSKLSFIIDGLMQSKKYDFVACRYLPFAALAGLDKYAYKLLLDIDDMPAQATAAHLDVKKGVRGLYQKLMLKRMQKETLWWITNSHTCFLPNNNQAIKYGCRHLPNIPIVEAVEHVSMRESKNLLFIGKLDWRPNYEGVARFIRNCWPSVIERQPDAKFLIAGKGLPEEYKAEFSKSKNIELLGFVDDLERFYGNGNIFVSPVYSGAGTNIKVIEAMAMGKACVLTPFSAKGYESLLINRDNVFIANSDNEMIEQSVALLSDSNLCHSMMRKSTSLVSEHFSQRRVNTIIKSVIGD